MSEPSSIGSIYTDVLVEYPHRRHALILPLAVTTWDADPLGRVPVTAHKINRCVEQLDSTLRKTKI